jgi:hypothetical protein
MAEAVVRRGVREWFHAATGAGSGAPVDQTYWLGARVEAAKIRFFGFFRTEQDALDAVT